MLLIEDFGCNLDNFSKRFLKCTLEILLSYVLMFTVKFTSLAFRYKNSKIIVALKYFDVLRLRRINQKIQF